MQNKDLATTAVLLDETQVIKKLLPKIKFPAPEQQAIVAQADAFISIIRQNKNFSVAGRCLECGDGTGLLAKGTFPGILRG